MVSSCSAYGCTNRYEKGSRITFHLFPHKNAERLKIWIQNMRRLNWNPTPSTTICSAHFTAECFIFRKDAQDSDRRLLKDDAVPTIFNFPQHLLPKTANLRKLPAKRDFCVAFGPESCADPPSVTSVNTTKTSILGTNTEEMNCSFANQMESKNSRSCGTLTDVYITKHQSRGTQTRRIRQPQKLTGRIKALRMKLKRRDDKINSMSQLLKSLKLKSLVNEEQFGFLSDRFSGVPLEVLKNEMKNSKRKAEGRRYSQTMKEFSLMLHFYSPAAYEFVRKVLSLPHQDSLRKWTNSVDANPGFLTETMDYIAHRILKSGKTGECSLIFDSMSIRKQTVWDPTDKRFRGFVDYGVPDLEGSETMATEALVFQAVSLNDAWKYPVAYFFVNKVSAQVQSQLLKNCLECLAERNIVVVATVCDGTYTNQETGRELGCSFDYDNIDCSFHHPVFEDQKVYFLFDPCHMMKLMRNLLHDFGTINLPGGRNTTDKVEWRFIHQLHNLQVDAGLKLGNKLTKEHIQFRNRKMNVRLAVQVLSKSVADSIDFLREDNCSPNFYGSATTTEFIRKIDLLFDVLNAKNPYGKYSKAALRLNNEHIWKKIFCEAKELLVGMMDSNYKLIGTGKRKTVVIGFLATIQGVERISDLLLRRDVAQFKYILPYKFSQDHLEIFFSKIRRRGGWNNNPDQLQFKWALKKLILKNNVLSSRRANCSELDLEHDSDSLFSFKESSRRSGVCTSDCAPEIPAVQELNEEDHLIGSQYLTTTTVQDNVLYYIAGYIIRKIGKNLLECEICYNSIFNWWSPGCYEQNLEASHLTKRKDRGGLLYASESTFIVIKSSEIVFRSHIFATKTKVTPEKNIHMKMLNAVTREILPNKKVFPNLLDHDCDTEFLIEEGHRCQIIKKIAQTYFQMRLRTYALVHTSEIVNKQVGLRRKLTKLVLFKNQ